MATFFGSDFYCITDVTPIDKLVTDPSQLIAQRLARRLQVQRGALQAISDDPDFGFDLRSLLNAKLGPNSINVYTSQVQAEVLKDEQVQSADVQMSLNNGILTVSINGVAASGPFQLTVSVHELTGDMVFSF